jgi:hypothetical protein
MGVPDLRKTNRTIPQEELGLAGVPEFGCVQLFVGLSLLSVNLLQVDPKKDFSFEVLITACAKYNVLVR